MHNYITHHKYITRHHDPSVNSVLFTSHADDSCWLSFPLKQNVPLAYKTLQLWNRMSSYQIARILSTKRSSSFILIIYHLENITNILNYHARTIRNVLVNGVYVLGYWHSSICHVQKCECTHEHNIHINCF
jgi:hypothetical protein